MIKPNKRKSTKEGINLISNIQSLTSNNHRGITLVALIITIIVMLILVGVSVMLAIKGDLFGIAKRAAKKTEKAKKAEQVLANGRIKIGDTWYDSLEDYVAGNPSKDQNESNIRFVYEPKGWTKGPVKVKIETTAETEGFTLQYSTDGINWDNYTTGTEITISENGGAIYARLWSSEGNEGEVATGNVANIDKEAPTISTLLNSGGQSPTSIDLKIGITDESSGFSKIEWYYKKDTDPESKYEENKQTEEDIAMLGGTAGTKTEVIKERKITGLSKSSTYNIYAIVYDVAGNPKRSPETGAINIETGNMPGGESSIGFSYSTENWTQDSVFVTIENKTGISEYNIKYSKDNSTWEDYEEPVEMSANGNIYAKLVDDEENEGEAATGNVANIDTDGPTINTEINSVDVSETTIDLGIEVTDSSSGISKIEWYYKKDIDPESKYAENMKTDEYQTMNGKEAGEKTAVTKTKTITGLTSGTTYNIYAKIYDVAGNSTRNPLGEETITIKTAKPSDMNMTAYNNAAKDSKGLLLSNVTVTRITDGKTATVPRGFKIVSGIDGTKSITDGLVIQDEDGNEFVWIPVEVTEGDTETDIASFYRSAWADNTRGRSLMNDTDFREPYSGGYTTPEGKTEAEEYAEMVKSVYKNKGFYIGRYEAGSKTERTNKANGTTEMVVKQGQYPYNYVSWGASMTDYTSNVTYDGKDQGKGALLLSKEMYQSKDVGVTSTLCYGIQWDAMLDYIKDEKSVTDYTSWNITSSPKHLTGSSTGDLCKNIYDIVGNLSESIMTQHKYATHRLMRGGRYINSSIDHPPSYVSYQYYSGVSEYCGFRPVLYIK